MERVLLDEIINTDYGQFDVVWSPTAGFDGNWDRFFTGQVNGLVGAADPSGVYLNFARRSGGSRVRALLLDSQPALPSPFYEDVVEVSITVPDGVDVAWVSWASETGGAMDLPPGTYRLRVSAHGRDFAADNELLEGVIDEYVLELWRTDIRRTDTRPDKVMRVGSDNARYWHRDVGSRREPDA